MSVMEYQKVTRLSLAFLASLLVLYAVVLVRTAWLCDDAYIMFRTADNLVNGFGLRWNIAERVQTYTHPLWMFIFSGIYFFTREAYYTGIVLSIAVSVLSVAVVCFFIANSRFNGVIAAVTLILSRAFVDYSTSGLENPLNHLLLALFILVFFTDKVLKHRVFYLAFIAALCTLNRMDHVLFFIPPLVYIIWQRRPFRRAGVMMLGFLPFFLWEIFSVIYYGFPFPNTAYAKLNTGMDSTLLMIQGVRYLYESLKNDPLTLVVTLMGIIAALFTKDRKKIAMAAGILLYLLYVVRVGGDFMSGRFLTGPFLVGVSLLVMSWRGKTLRSVLLLLFIMILGFTASTPPPLSGPGYQSSSESWYYGISDARGFYYPANGLLSPQREGPDPAHKWVTKGKWLRDNPQPLWTSGSVGMLGYYAGPGTHFLDPLALTDPLLARLPARLDKVHRIGHFTRAVPEGYKKSLKISGNHIEDEDLARYYEQLRLITRGDILAPGRFEAIWKMNTGQYEHLIDMQRYLNADTGEK